jgi:1,2-beta-oligoglucan phosphorylase
MKVTNPLGLVFAFFDDGAVRSIEADGIRIGLRPPEPFSQTGANLYLRKRGSRIDFTPLLGPGSPSRFVAADGGGLARGSWAGLEYECALQLASSQLSWRWEVRVESRLDEPVELDVIYVQDVGLRAAAPGLVNEQYVSQYIERRVLEDPQHGRVVCCRQNMRESVGHPWLMIACAGRAVAASTDGLQFYGRTFRATGEPEALRAAELSGELAGEASIAALQAAPFVLRSKQSQTSTFVASYQADHPQASSESDLQPLPELMRGFADTLWLTAASARGGAAPVRDRFKSPTLLPAEDLSQAELGELFGGDWRHVEEVDGRLLSFFADGPKHVVLRAKEERVDRPHGHILQAKGGFVPDERILSTTAFACGVFNSHLTQGNTNFNTFLSVCTNPAAPALEGQRVLVQLEDGSGEYLLGVPSAFEMGLNHCRWIYKHGSHCLQVCTWTSPDDPRVNFDFKVLRGGAVRVALTHQFDPSNGWQIASGAAHEFSARPRADSMLAAQFPRAQFRVLVNTRDCAYRGHTANVLDGGQPASALFVIEVAQTSSFSISFIGEVDGPVRADALQNADASRHADCERAESTWRELSRELTLSGGKAIAAIRESLPWYGMNALVHYLTPYGLEQFSGAAWGTRDVCQGPFELLLAAEKYAEAKQVLRSVFSHQNPEGGWPQWWMFDRYRTVRAGDAHGDVIYWCVLAVCSYIRASGDFAVLDEQLPYFAAEQTAGGPTTALAEHVDRVIDMVVASFVPGTALVQFGGGDWNDSLQPVSKDLARRMISSWTVQMCFQALNEYREICERSGRNDKAKQLDDITQRILADFHRYLVRDGVVAGYGLVGDGRNIDVLLHPTDEKTGVHYSLLPMNRGVISGVFDKQQAERHSEIIEQHLKGPDGARLMDRPLRYRGGPQTLFQRAESSTYFGREIGLMYVHEHLRYAESQARLGKPDAFLRALRQAIPVDYREIVPQADLRQANCYYTSSDVLFRSRYDADARYADVVAGRMPLRAGWRVYSSGPGIYVALVVSRLLGLRIEFGELILDPVMARELDGLRASLRFRGRRVTFAYRVSGPGFGPRALSVNGKPADFEREKNSYREGGAVIPLARFVAMLDRDENSVEIDI